jgi:hypothetical protein
MLSIGHLLLPENEVVYQGFLYNLPSQSKRGIGGTTIALVPVVSLMLLFETFTS